MAHPATHVPHVHTRTHTILSSRCNQDHWTEAQQARRGHLFLGSNHDAHQEVSVRRDGGTVGGLSATERQTGQLDTGEGCGEGGGAITAQRTVYEA